MPKWNEYTIKETLADNDEVMLYDATARANKRGLMSKFWDYVVDKMSTAVISKLATENKTIIGAINKLNSDRVGYFQANSDINQLMDYAIKADRKIIAFDAYDVENFFPNNSNWWSGLISINNPGNYGAMIVFSLSDFSIYKCIWNGSENKSNWEKIS